MKRIFALRLALVPVLAAFFLTGCAGSLTTTTTPTSTTSTTDTASFQFPFIVSVSNGTESVSPYQMTLSSYQYLPGHGWFWADGIGMFGYDLMDYADQIPSLAAGELTITVEHDATVGDIAFFDDEGVEIEDLLLSGVPELLPGTYYLRAVVGKTNGEAYANFYCFVKLIVD